MSLLMLKEISRIYGTQENFVIGINKVTLTVQEGESIAVMGASGSGKSTLLGIIGTIDSPTTGEYMIQGKEISSFGSREKAALRNRFFGFVTQDFALIPHYTVERNVRLPLDYMHMSGKEKKCRVEKILRKLHIGDKKKAYPSQLSGGQKQRVAIARALVNDAKVLLCDEPTGALDSATSSEIMGIFEELNRSGKTVIVVTHDAKVAASCKRLICIEDGRIKSDSLR
ncbi:ABC transporter ATP-binding protein [Blautia sp.]|uniref:ABC transporter ATP-binding protein n=1 Tax=Blautia sp. TaxID=1955243 RepID=UPI003AB5D076